MRVKSTTVAWVLLGILTAGAVLITLGKREEQANPSLDSMGPSGLSAFGQLLSENGYRVTSTLTAMPSYQPTENVLVIPLDETGNSLIDDDAGVGVAQQVARFLEKGGRVIVLRIPVEFSGASKSLRRQEVRNRISGEKFAIHARPVNWGDASPSGFLNAPTSASIWSIGQSQAGFGGLTRFGKGVAFTLEDGMIATNRFLDRERNADVLMQSVAMVAPKGSQLVFLGSSFYDESPSLIELLGPGAIAAWLQIIFCFVVVVFTLGKRFGLAEEVVTTQKGQRELVDAVAEIYRRARSTRVACRAAYDRADQEVRKALKLTAEAPAYERDARIPGALALEFRRVFEGSIDALPAAEAFARCRELRRQVRRFLSRGDARLAGSGEDVA